MQESDASTSRSDAPAADDVLKRAQEEYERCRAEGAPFWVIAVDVLGLDRIAERTAGAEVPILRAVADVLRGSPHGEGLFACDENRRIVAMLPGAPEADIDVLCRHALADGDKLAVAGLATPLRRRLSIGLARDQHPDDLPLSTLMRVAHKGADVARNRGGGCAVHTKVYGLVQRDSPRADDPQPDSSSTREETRLDGKAPERSRGPEQKVPASIALVPTVPRAHPPRDRPPGGPSTGTKEPAAATAPPGAEPPGQTSLRDQLEKIIAEASGAHPRAEHLQKQVHDVVDLLTAEAVELARRESRSADPVPAAATTPRAAVPLSHEQEIDRLERRIGKLTDALEATERRLAEASPPADRTGVASTFKSVQGLRETETDRDLKMSLLKQIVDANIELRRLMDARQATAETERSVLIPPPPQSSPQDTPRPAPGHGTPQQR